MAEGRDGGSHHLSPLEEQYIREAEEEEVGVEAQIQREKDLASQKLWYSFQDSATAVSHLFRGALDVCRQCVECGVKHGQRKRTRDIVTWLKKKRKVIQREELLAFLLDKPYPPDSILHFGSERSEDLSGQHHSSHFPHSHHPPHTTRPILTSSSIGEFSFPPPVPIPMSASAPCFGGPLSSPRGRWALLGRDEQGLPSDGELYTMRENGRKRLNSTAGNIEFSQESPPLSKRMKI